VARGDAGSGARAAVVWCMVRATECLTLAATAGLASDDASSAVIRARVLVRGGSPLAGGSRLYGGRRKVEPRPL